MKKYSTIIAFVLIGILVMSVGALAGWYVVLRTKGQTLSWQDAARGFGINTPQAGQNGSNYAQMGIGTGDDGSGNFSVGGGNAGGVNALPGGTGSVTGQGAGIDSSGNSLAGTANTSIGTSTTSITTYKTPRLWHVTKAPVAGFTFATTAPALYFAERASGYVFHADAVSGEVLRRTNTLMPKTYSAILAHDGGVLYQSLNDATGVVQTFSGSIGSSTSSQIGALVGVNLRNNILAMDADPDAKNIFFIMAGDSGFVGVTEPWIEGKSGKEKQVFSSTISNWRPFALSDGRLIIVEKPQDAANGYAYEVKADGTLTPLIREAPGLTVLPLSGSSALVFGTSANNTLTLFAKTSTTTYALPVRTLADKCVWAPYTPPTKKKPGSDLVIYCAVPSDASMKNFLENWYMGALHTSDSWWKINLTTGASTQVLDANTQGTSLDVVDPAIDASGTLLGFKNGADNSLWVLRIQK